VKARVALVLVVLVTAASLSTMFAKATHQDRKDGNDVSGKLDIRAVNTFGSISRPGWEIIASSRTTARSLRDRGFILVHLDTFGDTRPDYYALVSSNGSSFKGRLWRDLASRPDRVVGTVPVSRPDRFSVTVRVPLSKMNLGGKMRLTYRWWARSLFTGTGCRRVCIDRAPSKGVVTENNGKPSPSPTDTEDPGLTESPEPSTTPDPTESPGASPFTSPTP